MKLKLVNRSDWPTPLLKVLTAWVCKREGLGKSAAYAVTVKGCRSNSWGGRGGRFGQRVWLDVRYRAKWPLEVKDHRFKWSKPYQLRNRLELLVMLLAHEAHHATGGNPEHFRKAYETPEGDVRYRIDRDSMEFRCDAAADRAVDDFRHEFPVIRAAIRKLMAAERARLRAAKAAAVAKRTDPGPKLAKAEAMLDKWQRKQKAAANRVRKYLRQVRYYSGKVAAASGKSR